MKIGILTFSWANNYGAMLQAYALQRYLSSRGHDVQIIDYRPLRQVSTFKKWFFSKTPNKTIRKWELLYKDIMFEIFRKKHLERTPDIFYKLEDLTFIQNCYDMLVTGSDQVWNPDYLSQIDGFFDVFLLSFVGPETKKISYAASFGRASASDINCRFRGTMSTSLQKLDAISVREKSGRKLVFDLTGREDAVYVLDPTLLLCKKQYDEITGKNKKHRNYMFSYMLHGVESEAISISGKVCKSLNLQLIKCDSIKTTIRKGYKLPSVTAWLEFVRDASFMITNSFHGVIFCLLFHTPFIAIGLRGKSESMNTRIIELLDILGISDRFIFSNQEITDKMLSKEMLWSDIDKKVHEMRIDSINFLIEQGL